MEYHGSNEDDILNQTVLGLPDWSAIFGGNGSDTITVGFGTAFGEAGNNTIIGTRNASAVAYYRAPAGIVADLTTGKIQNGYGGIDTVTGIYWLRGSSHDDYIKGNINSVIPENIQGAGGNDTIIGGGGSTSVSYWGMTAAETRISYDAAADTYTVSKKDGTVDKLTNISIIEFNGNDGSHDVIYRGIPTWTIYAKTIATIASNYGSHPTTINVNPTWFNTLQIPLNNFSYRTDTFHVQNPLPKNQVGYGSFAQLTGNHQQVFFSGWVSENPNAGAAFILDYQNGIPTKLQYHPIEGATHSWVLDNGNGTQSVAFMGVDEGKLAAGQNTPATSPSYLFDISTGTWSSLPFQSASHNSIPFDYNGDGKMDVVAQSWGAPFNTFFILRNDGGTFTPTPLGDPTQNIGSMSVAPLGWQKDGTFAMFIGDGTTIPQFNIGIATNSILYFDKTLSHVVNAVALPAGYFEATVFADVPMVLPDWVNSVGRSHDVTAKAIDFNGDGSLDLIVSSMLWSTKTTYCVLQFLENQDGKFVDVTSSHLFNWCLAGGGIHRLDFRDVNDDGFVDILTSDQGSSDTSTIETASLTTGSRVLLNDGVGHFVNVVQQQINLSGQYLSSYIPSVDDQNHLRWTSIEPSGTNTDGVTVYTTSLQIALSTGPNGTDPSLSGAPGFNEFYYLLKYPEVAASVLAGNFSSGLDQYLKLGKSVGNFAFAPGATVRGSNHGDDLTGREGNERLFGGTGNDTLTGSTGNDNIDGGAGIDTSIYSGSRGSYTLTLGPTATVQDRRSTAQSDGSDSLKSIERLKFSDVSVALDLDGHAGQAAKLLGAVFGASSVANKQFVGIALSLLDGGMSYEQLASAALGVTGKTSNADVASLLWTNLFGAAPTTDQVAPIVSILDGGMSQGALTVLAADTSLNAEKINLVGLSQSGIDFI